MIDLEQEVEMRWHSSNKQYFQSKGYVFTNWKDIFIIKARHLSDSSDARVKYQCDRCGNIIETKYSNYNRTLDDLCHLCAIAEKQTISFDTIRQLFESKGYILLSNKEDYKNKYSILAYLCPYHGFKTTTYTSFKQCYGCMECRSERNSGENHHNWKGGTSELKKCLRQFISPWVADSMKQCDFKCVLTRDKNWDVHHLTSFNTIVKQTLEELNLPVKQNIGEYTQQELIDINTKCLQLHYSYGLGVCLEKSLHTLFHCHYGYGDNTPEQFQEFQQRYLSGEFKE